MAGLLPLAFLTREAMEVRLTFGLGLNAPLGLALRSSLIFWPFKLRTGSASGTSVAHTGISQGSGLEARGGAFSFDASSIAPGILRRSGLAPLGRNVLALTPVTIGRGSGTGRSGQVGRGNSTMSGFLLFIKTFLGEPKFLGDPDDSAIIVSDRSNVGTEMLGMLWALATIGTLGTLGTSSGSVGVITLTLVFETLRWAACLRVFFKLLKEFIF